MAVDGSDSEGDLNEIIEERLGEDYFSPNFKEYVLKEQLKSWRFHDRGWVFWSEQDHEIEPSLSLDNFADFNPNVSAIPKVRRALQNLIRELSSCLVQFWAATETLEGRTNLTTRNQPFALVPTRTTNKSLVAFEKQLLCEYRMKMCSSEYNNCFYADANSGEEHFGVPGRVFLHQFAESIPNVQYYFKKEYPQLDDAIQCSVKGSWALPVFEHSSRTRVGVLEFVSLCSLPSVWQDESFLHKMRDIFQECGLICLDGYTHWNGKKLRFVQRIQDPTLAPTPKLLKDRGLMLQLDQLVQPSTDAIHSGMNVINEKQNYILHSLGALQDEEVTMQLDSPHQPPLDSSNNGHNVVPPEENITSVTSLEEGKRKTQRENKGTGVKIELSLDDILKCMGMKRKAAAQKLKVSESTFKRACREHAIDRWQPRNIDNIVGRLRPSHVENQGQTSQLNSNLPFQPLPVEIQGQTLQLNSDEQSNQAVPGIAHMIPGVQDANRVTIRAKYGEKTIKFHLSFSSRLVDFQQEVAKRLPLEVGTYYAEYKDEEGVLISIACDDDLKDCMDTSRSQGNTSIEVQLKLEKPLVNLNPAN